MIKQYLALAMAIFAAMGAHAATYSYTGPNYDTFTYTTPPCVSGGCADFTVLMRTQGTFTTATPLGMNIGPIDITGQITAFSFFDGITTYASSDPLVRIERVQVVTNGVGNITNFDLILQRWHDPGPHVAGVSRVDFVTASHVRSIGDHNLLCTGIGTSGNGVADTCQTSLGDTDFGNGYELIGAFPVLTAAPPTPPAATPSAVPTLGEWGLLLLAVCVGGAGVMAQRRRS